MRIAILGGGAVTRIFYAPIFRNGAPGISLAAVVDPSQDALEKLGVFPQGTELIRTPFEHYLQNLSHDVIDAVIIALPHHLHEPSVMAALHQGLHVFCEKPLGLTAESVQRMCVASINADRVLKVCQPRRSFKAAGAIRDLIKSGWLGAIRSVEWKEGQPYAWPAESLAQVLEGQGGGELVDIGAHVFDLLVWWLGELEVVGYTDDSAGGTAAEYSIQLVSDGGVPIRVELSRLFHLENVVDIVFQRGRVHWDVKTSSNFELELTVGGQVRRAGIHPSPTLGDAQSMREAIQFQLLEFRNAIREASTTGDRLTEALGYVHILEQCRNRQKRRSSIQPSPSAGRAVVTGASGFIGTRLVEMLEGRGVSVLALARRAQSCVRLARRPVEIRLADVRNRSQLEHALAEGGDVIYHCAVASGNTQTVWETVVDGTLQVLQSAEAKGFRRVVVFSSMLALGNPAAQGFVDDHSRPNRSELEYAKAKWEMERQCGRFAAQSRLEVVILRPTCVFGPFGRDFGSVPLDRVAKGEFFFLDSGRGLANLVFVDNLIEAAILAASVKCTSGSTFIVNEEDWPMNWAEFFVPQIGRAFGEDTRIPDLSSERLLALEADHRRNHSFPAVVRNAIRSHKACAEWVAQHPLFRAWKTVQRSQRRPHAESGTRTSSARASGAQLGNQDTIQLERAMSESRSFPYGQFYRSFFTTQAVYSSDAARKTLSWRPRIDRATAMNETLGWIQKAYRGVDPNS